MLAWCLVAAVANAAACILMLAAGKHYIYAVIFGWWAIHWATQALIERRRMREEALAGEALKMFFGGKGG